jgi:hypothetical protein
MENVQRQRREKVTRKICGVGFGEGDEVDVDMDGGELIFPKAATSGG